MAKAATSEEKTIVQASKATVSSFLKQLKEDPEIKPFLVPIPDYGMVNVILLSRILQKLEGNAKF